MTDREPSFTSDFSTRPWATPTPEAEAGADPWAAVSALLWAVAVAAWVCVVPLVLVAWRWAL
jgi:hypothetical protein